MFLTFLEDRGKITRLWCELTKQTRHVKLPVGETILPQFNSCDFKAAFIQKATGNGNATETVVPLSEQMELNVFVHTEETRRKRQSN